jgi:hypothetical protein
MQWRLRVSAPPGVWGLRTAGARARVRSPVPTALAALALAQPAPAAVLPRLRAAAAGHELRGDVNLSMLLTPSTASRRAPAPAETRPLSLVFAAAGGSRLPPA